MLDIIALHALFGTSIPISKQLLHFTSPVFLTGIRMFIAGVLLVGFNILRKKGINGIERKFWWPYLQIIIVGVYFKYVLRSWGLAHMPAVKLAFLLNVSPFVSALFSYIVFNEKLTRKQWLGLIIGFVGCLPILITTSTPEQGIGELFYISWPELAIFAAIVAHCYGLIVSRTLIRDNNHAASLTNGVRMFGGGVLALITAFFIEGFHVSHIGEFADWLAILIVVSNIICHNFYLRLLKYYTVTFVSFTDFLSPLFIGLYSWLFLKETITWHYFTSGAVVLIGLYLFYMDELQTTIHVQQKVPQVVPKI